MENKICIKCNLKKQIIEFVKTKNGYRNICRDCNNKHQRENYKKNSKKHLERNKKYLKERGIDRTEYFKKYREENREELLIKKREYHWNNREDILKKKKEYTENNKDKIKISSKNYYENNKDKIRNYQNEYEKKRKTEDKNYRLRINLRARIREAIKNNGTKKSYSTIELMGCDIAFLKEYLQQQFKTGMSWENYGEWEIDHIIPCAAFDLKDEMQQKECFHYSNLQPLWKNENRMKGAKIA